MRRTRQAIQRALIELILDKGYETTTVTDIINRADVGRSTFYAHFTDKQDVLFGNLDDLVFLHAGPPSEGPLFGFSLPMFEHVQSQRQLVSALLGRRGGGAVIARGEQMLAEVVRRELLARAPQPTPRLDLVVTAVVGAFMGLLRGWADDQFAATPVEMDRTFRTVVTPGVTMILTSGEPA
ncbi:TetR/AcrR family transcriptional regulator [Streptosporangiaceae bacterium NEAU-GS5]|nr:TetR/AcrR family transcriptional regulator [Streptosporangiaceae bacterium NEAU-GS5]